MRAISIAVAMTMTPPNLEPVWEVLRRKRLASGPRTSPPSFPLYPLSPIDRSDRSLRNIFINDRSLRTGEVQEGENPILSVPADTTIRTAFLAEELATALHDTRNLACYRALVRQYPASVLRSALGFVLEVPPAAITRSRAAYFVWLVQHHGGRTPRPRNPQPSAEIP